MTKLRLERSFTVWSHATQMALLGMDRYADLYVRGFVKSRSWIAIPLEAQAYQLDARFAMPSTAVFSVEDEVKSWSEQGRYEPGRPLASTSSSKFKLEKRKAPGACGEAPGAGGGVRRSLGKLFAGLCTTSKIVRLAGRVSAARRT